MTHSIKIVEPGREVTFTSDVPALAVAMAREWSDKPTKYDLGETLKPPTQVAQAQGFEAFGPMGGRL